MSCLFVAVHLYLTAKITGTAWVSHSQVLLWAQRLNRFTPSCFRFPGLLSSPKPTRFCLVHSIKTVLIKVLKTYMPPKTKNRVPIIKEYSSTVGPGVSCITSTCDPSFLPIAVHELTFSHTIHYHINVDHLWTSFQISRNIYQVFFFPYYYTSCSKFTFSKWDSLVLLPKQLLFSIPNANPQLSTVKTSLRFHPFIPFLQLLF